jgi:hypothetical protein
MQIKRYKMRSVAVENGRKTLVEFPLEIEGDRAFVIWDTILLPGYKFKARLEIDPDLLEKISSSCDFQYSGDLILPRPENN